MQIDILSETKMWKAYDYIASISEAVTKEFLKKFPTLKNRIILILKEKSKIHPGNTVS